MAESIKSNKSDFKLAIFSLVIFAVGLFLGSGLTLTLVQSSPSGQLTAINPAPTTTTQALQQTPQAVVHAKDLVDDDPSIGPADAKIVVVEFADFECPFCGGVMGLNYKVEEYLKSRDPEWEPAVPRLKELAKQGKIRFVYRDFPLDMHQNAQKSAESAECADEQGKFWEYHDKVFENQGDLSVTNLKKFAKDVGLDTNQFDNCLDSGKYYDEVRKDFNDGSKAGVSGTPAFFINNVYLNGAYSASAFISLIGELS
ncbi:MAG TPA: thioredoxin domain-containing protein [archaeon]|nr:thioredoxin domain-containing protein [archaeon]